MAHAMAVAFVHVPVLVSVATSRRHPTLIEQLVPSVVLVMFVHPVGTVGFVVLL
jgi:hypothetical protein